MKGIHTHGQVILPRSLSVIKITASNVLKLMPLDAACVLFAIKIVFLLGSPGRLARARRMLARRASTGEDFGEGIILGSS